MVKNEGIIPLSNVDVGIGVCSARGVMEDGRPVELRGECKPTGELKSIALLDKWRHHGLTAGESYTISLYDLGSAMKIAKLTYADISVTIAYRPWYSPFYGRPKQVRLVGALDEGGRAEWQFRPLDDN